MLLYSAVLLVGFLILFKSADYFVIGSVAAANNFNISPIIIGLTIVAIGTSAPEIFVSATSSLQGDADISVGNAIGSNIANVGMVLGITAMLSPLPIHRQILKNDIPILIFVTLCAGVVLMNYQLTPLDGVLLLFGLVVFLVRIVVAHRNKRAAGLVVEINELSDLPRVTTRRSVLMMFFSLVLLLISSELVVWSAIHIAIAMGVSQLLVGLTVVAVGTSLPELVVSVTSAMKGHPDLAVGNIIGSNIFNILAVLAIPCLLSPLEFSPAIFWRDYAFMLLMTVLLAAFCYAAGTRRRVGRIEGGLLLLVWIGYLVLLYQTTAGP